MDEEINNYNIVKNDVLNCINNNINTIFLVGLGGNGKTYLINDIRTHLNSNGYVINYQSDFVSENAFNEKLNMNTKKIFETHIDPFHKYNMNVPPSTVVLDMNHIEF
jgi:chromosomal replication initiation ATPase DnaA